LKRRYKRSNWHNTVHYSKRKDYTDMLAMHFEEHETSLSDYTATIWKGWFTPPMTARYRFHQSCNDHCDLTLGKTPGQDTDTEKILDINHWSEYRRVSYTEYGGQTRISKWIQLEKGKKYYIHSAHLEHNWVQPFSTGVEIEQAVMNAKHPNNVKEVQRLGFSTEDKREMHRVTITKPDDKDFKLLVRGGAPNFHKAISGSLKATDSEWTW